MIHDDIRTLTRPPADAGPPMMRPLRPLRGLRLIRARRLLLRRYRWMYDAPAAASRIVMRAALNRVFPMSGKWRNWR